MTSSNCLSHDKTALVLDTSALINLRASTLGERIIRAIPNEIFVPTIVIRELQHERGKLNGEHNFLQGLIGKGYIQPLELHGCSLGDFEKLISKGSSLGDGEAATIALSISQRLLPVIDDGKARSLASTLQMTTALAWSLDLFIHPSVITELGDDRYVNAIFLALRDGRMRIDEERCDFIVELIGHARALECHSLPKYKQRRTLWANSDE